MFGIRLPLNFNSPYKSQSIVEFWRRWHMTLSRFLRDYLYIPLGGSRGSGSRRSVNLMITMLLGGLWHGAGWNFVLWGALHGLYLMVNHAWRSVAAGRGRDPDRSSVAGKALSRLVTFVAILFAWVFFRAESLAGALNMLKAMAGLNGAGAERVLAQDPLAQVVLLAVLFVISWFAPSTQQIMLRYQPALETYRGDLSPERLPEIFRWRPGIVWSVLAALITILAVDQMRNVTEFLYFQF
jgi:D-alanyl-lipoteichoic acid acyltransferase DltB (MBOAT superfamily)